MPTDSLRIIHDTVFTKGENAYDLVNKIDAMYQNAWTKLMVVGGLIVAVATIVIPWWLNRIRTQQAKNDKEADRAVYEKQIVDLKKELDIEFDRKISNELAKYNEGIEKITSGAKAAHFYLLADSHLNKDDKQYAFVNFIAALGHALKAEDLANVKAILLRVTKDCIPLLSLDEIMAADRVYKLQMDDLLTAISEADKNSLLFDSINQFKAAISKLVPPEKPKEQHNP